MRVSFTSRGNGIAKQYWPTFLLAVLGNKNFEISVLNNELWTTLAHRSKGTAREYTSP